MAQDNYNHPSYLTRQAWDYGPTTAGASGTSLRIAYPWQVRFRKAVGIVQVAGTIGTNVSSIIYSGTTALGTITYGTGGNTIGALGTSADMNATIPINTIVSVVNGLDATATTTINIEAYLDPQATWTGPNN